jgi:hypothetical protein
MEIGTVIEIVREIAIESVVEIETETETGAARTGTETGTAEAKGSVSRLSRRRQQMRDGNPFPEH